MMKKYPIQYNDEKTYLDVRQNGKIVKLGWIREKKNSYEFKMHGRNGDYDIRNKLPTKITLFNQRIRWKNIFW